MHHTATTRLMSIVVAAATVGASPVSAAGTSAAPPARHCPDDHVVVDQAPLRAGDGTRMGVARLFAGTLDGSPGFCFDVSVGPRYRQPLAPLRKRLSTSSPLTDSPSVVGTTEPARRQFPLGSYASFYEPGCTARATAVLRVGGRRATASLSGSL